MDKVQEILISKIFPKKYKYYKEMEKNYCRVLDVNNEELSRLRSYKEKCNCLEEKVKDILDKNFTIIKIIEKNSETLIIYYDYRLEGKTLYLDSLYKDRIVTLYFDIQEEYLNNNYSKYPMFKKMKIIDFTISGTNRGKGYGSEVMTSLINLAKRLKCTEIYGKIEPTDYKEIYDENNKLKKYPNDFYKNHGFDVPEKSGKIFLNLEKIRDKRAY